MEILPLKDGELWWKQECFDAHQSEKILLQLQEEINWQQKKIRMFGKWIDQPRLTAWYADPGLSYTYSGLEWEPMKWNDILLDLKRIVENYAQHSFNSVLLNLYRDGKDSMGWHSDDEPELGKNPVIASLSFGQSRMFHLKHRFDKSTEKVRMELGNGSLLVMRGTTQHFWHHQIPKSKRPLQTRINLTFRQIQTSPA